MTNCTANAENLNVTAKAEIEMRWITDCRMRAKRKRYASESVMEVLSATTAMSIRLPKIGKPSMQFAWARVRRCINGERFEFSGLNPFAATALVRTSFERMTSMSNKRNNDQATKPVRVVSVGFMFFRDDVSCVVLRVKDASLEA